MPITLDGTLGVGTPGITLAGSAITASANQLNSSAEDVNSENLIINGDFTVWQRGTSSSVVGAYVAADRWVNNGTGGTVTQAKIDLTLGSTLGGNNVKSILRQTVSGQTLSSQFANTVQRLEGVHNYAGQTITVLGWAGRSSGAGNLVLGAAQTFGTGGSPSAEVTLPSTTITLSGTMQPFAAVINVPSITGKTLGTSGTDQFILRFYTSAGTDLGSTTNNLGLQTIGVDLWGIHIRVGTWTAADTSLYRPRAPGAELGLCQRYYEVCNAVVKPTANSTGMAFKVTKRGLPVLAATFDAGTGATFAVMASSVNGFYQNVAHSQDATATVRADAEL